MKDRIINYLAQGMKPADVAAVVGCSAGYLSQLAKNEDFMAVLAEKKKEFLSVTTEEDKFITTKYGNMELKLLNAIDGAMVSAELPALVRALEVVAARQEKRLQRLALPAGFQNNQDRVVINITVPAHAIPEYQINSTREVVAIGERAIAPLSSTGVKDLFHRIAASKNAPNKEVAEVPMEVLDMKEIDRMALTHGEEF